MNGHQDPKRPRKMNINKPLCLRVLVARKEMYRNRNIVLNYKLTNCNGPPSVIPEPLCYKTVRNKETE
jgi:hypothetical protein